MTVVAEPPSLLCAASPTGAASSATSFKLDDPWNLTDKVLETLRVDVLMNAQLAVIAGLLLSKVELLLLKAHTSNSRELLCNTIYSSLFLILFSFSFRNIHKGQHYLLSFYLTWDPNFLYLLQIKTKFINMLTLSDGTISQPPPPLHTRGSR